MRPEGAHQGGRPPPWLLAVKLVAPPEALNWVERGDEGGVVALRDLTLVRADQGERLWNAEGSCRTAVLRVRGLGGRWQGRDSSARSAAQANLAWSAANQDVIRALQDRLAAGLGW